MARTTLDSITLGQTQFDPEVAAGNVQIEGNVMKFAELMSMLDTFDKMFPVVTP